MYAKSIHYVFRRVLQEKTSTLLGHNH